MKGSCATCKYATNGEGWETDLPSDKRYCARKPPSVFIVPVMQQNPLNPRDVQQGLIAQTVCPIVPASHCCGEWQNQPLSN